MQQPMQEFPLKDGRKSFDGIYLVGGFMKLVGNICKQAASGCQNAINHICHKFRSGFGSLQETLFVKVKIFLFKR